MFNTGESEIEHMRRIRTRATILWALIHLGISYLLITYVPYGMFVVLAYILYSLQSQGMLQLLNSQETNSQLHVLSQKGPSEVESLRLELEELKERLSDLELHN